MNSNGNGTESNVGKSLKVLFGEKITHSFYRCASTTEQQPCRKYGVELPMWFWTHRMPEKTCEVNEITKVVNLLQWLSNSCPQPSSQGSPTILIVSPSATFTKVLKEKIEAKVPSVLKPKAPLVTVCDQITLHELSETASPVIAIFCFGSTVNDQSMNAFNANGLAAFEKAMSFPSTNLFISTCSVEWIYKAGSLRWKCQKWYEVVESYLLKEMPPVHAPDLSMADKASLKFPSFHGPLLPICCPMHEKEKSLVSGKDFFGGFCSKMCLQPFPCGRPNHVCLKTCHFGEPHDGCPFPCSKVLPCGHPCKMKCGEPCDCLEEVKATSSNCYHEIAVGFDADEMTVIKQQVPHLFHGRCIDSRRACTAQVPTFCAQCGGPFTIACAALTGTGHTLDTPVLECPDCKQRRRDIRIKIRQELLSELSAKKTEIRAGIRAHLKKYKLMTGSGTFQAGQQVYLNDTSALRDPFLADFDPSIEFLDMNDAEAMKDCHGVVVDCLIDPMDDASEVKYLVKLFTGLYILAADVGLQAIRGICSVQKSSAAPLLITASPSDTAATTNGTTSTLFKGLKGSKAHLHQVVKEVPTPSDWAEKNPSWSTYPHVNIGDVVVTVLDEDQEASATLGEPAAKVEASFPYTPDEDEGRDLKRHRDEKGSSRNSNTPSFTVCFSAPLSALQPIAIIGKDVVVDDPTKQVYEEEAGPATKTLVEKTVRTKIDKIVLKDSPIELRRDNVRDSEMMKLLDVVNMPFDEMPSPDTHVMDDRLMTKLPMALLLSNQLFQKKTITRRHEKPHNNNNHRRHQQQALHQTQQSQPFSVALVPLLFVSADEEALAEEALEKDLLSKLDERAEERFAAESENLFFSNDAARFEREQQLPPMKEPPTEMGRAVSSTPRPLLPSHELSELKTRFASLNPAPQKVKVDLEKKKYELSLKMGGKALALKLKAAYESLMKSLSDEMNIDKRHCGA